MTLPPHRPDNDGPPPLPQYVQYEPPKRRRPGLASGLVSSFVGWLVLSIATPLVYVVVDHSSHAADGIGLPELLWGGLVFLLPVLLVAGLVLTIVPRTRAFGGGLLIGFGVDLLMTCIVGYISIRSWNFTIPF